MIKVDFAVCFSKKIDSPSLKFTLNFAEKSSDS